MTKFPRWICYLRQLAGMSLTLLVDARPRHSPQKTSSYRNSSRFTANGTSRLAVPPKPPVSRWSGLVLGSTGVRP
jgi:hypothetical protein